MGPHLQVPYPAAQAPQFIPRAPASPCQMMMPQQHGGGGGGGPAAMYPSQFGLVSSLYISWLAKIRPKFAYIHQSDSYVCY